MVQYTNNQVVAVTTASVEVLPTCAGRKRRTGFLITNTTTGSDVVTIAKGDVAAIAGSGIILSPSLNYAESNSEGFLCWQGAVQVVSTGSHNIAVVETFDA